MILTKNPIKGHLVQLRCDECGYIRTVRFRPKDHFKTQVCRRCSALKTTNARDWKDRLARQINPEWDYVTAIRKLYATSKSIYKVVEALGVGQISHMTVYSDLKKHGAELTSWTS